MKTKEKLIEQYIELLEMYKIDENGIMVHSPLNLCATIISDLKQLKDEPESMIGKVGLFWDDDENDRNESIINVLKSVDCENKFKEYYKTTGSYDYQNFKPLTKEEMFKYIEDKYYE